MNQFQKQYTIYCKVNEDLFILIDFSLTVKAATLIFISWLGSAISSAKEEKSGFIYNLVKSQSAFWAAQTCVHFMTILTVWTLNSHFLTLIAHNHKMYVLSSTKIFEASQTNSVDPDRTAPVGAVRSGSTMFASMLMLDRHFRCRYFAGVLRTK